MEEMNPQESDFTGQSEDEDVMRHLILDKASLSSAASLIRTRSSYQMIGRRQASSPQPIRRSGVG